MKIYVVFKTVSSDYESYTEVERVCSSAKLGRDFCIKRLKTEYDEETVQKLIEQAEKYTKEWIQIGYTISYTIKEGLLDEDLD